MNRLGIWRGKRFLILGMILEGGNGGADWMSGVCGFLMSLICVWVGQC